MLGPLTVFTAAIGYLSSSLVCVQVFSLAGPPVGHPTSSRQVNEQNLVLSLWPWSVQIKQPPVNLS